MKSADQSRPLARAAAPRVACAQAAGAAPAAPSLASPLAALLTGHVLQDGEVILLILKPSRWFIILTSLKWAAAVAILLLGAQLYQGPLPMARSAIIELGIVVIAGRIVWALLQWIGRLYILTDLRIIRLDGVFSVDIFGCPLRKVARTRILYTMRERLFWLGTIEIVPSDEDYAIAQWQMVARPKEVHQQIVATINRAKQGSGLNH